MADDGGTGERTEKATPKKRRDAREKGQVMKSQDLVVAISLLVSFGALQMFAPNIGNSVARFATRILSGEYWNMALTPSGVINMIIEMGANIAAAVIPMLAVGLLAGVVGNILQVGFLFATKALTPKFGKLNPIKGLKNVFSMKVIFELVKTTAKLALIFYIVYLEIMNSMTSYPNIMNQTLYDAVLTIIDMIFNAVFKIVLVLAIIAVFDFGYQKWKFEKDLKMSKYEVKMEFKQQDGDPQIKGKIRQKQREMASMRMMNDVPDADVVITNPTHFAVALKYDEKETPAPKVIAKGQDIIALKIKEIAKENHIQIVEDKPLARSLYLYCEVGEMIPVEMYQAVAEILAQIYKTKKRV